MWPLHLRMCELWPSTRGHVTIFDAKEREMKTLSALSVLAILGSTVPAMPQDVTARELNGAERVRLIGPRLVANAEELNKLELSVISTQQVLSPAVSPTLGYGTAPPAQQVNNIKWAVVSPNGYPLCVALQYDSGPIYVTFDIFPACFKHNPNCTIHGIRQTTLYYDTPTVLWPWSPKETSHPQCSLISWQYPPKPAKLSPR
jgi:hypothetical protein